VQIRWLGQSAFHLAAGGTEVAIDPFGDMSRARERGLRFDYPPIQGIRADLLLVTHEHADHNAVEIVDGDPHVVRSTAGSFETPLGEVVSIAGEHDDVAGTKRGANMIVVFELGGLQICHFGDFGQRDLREEQAAAIGKPDLLFLPVGGGPTIDGAKAAEIAERLEAAIVVPMHYRTEALSFLEPIDGFLTAWTGEVHRLESDTLDTGSLPSTRPLAVVIAPPSAQTQ
jgi:L-ascorbate metabolism protein UlaG (beta-lactamase superfamily)